MRSARIWSVCTMIWGVAACVYKSSPPLDSLPALCEPPTRDGCSTYQCGPNSPFVNGFPINGLRPNGECNAQGIQLLPGSMAGGAGNKCAGATLDFDDQDNTLIGRRGKDIVCSGEDLENASFVVRSWRNQSQTIHVRSVAMYMDSTGEFRKAYHIVGSGASLCLKEHSKKLLEQLQVDRSYSADSDPVARDQFVVPIRSELYNIHGAAYDINPDWRLQEREWLHLACVGDALAKRSFYDLQTDNLSRSRAALRMLTANYCGKMPITTRGIEINWGFQRTDLGCSVEAGWTEDGASCITRPRILYRDLQNPSVPGNLPERLTKLCPNCDVIAWEKAIRTCAQNDVRPTCAPCPAPPPKHLESYLK